MIVQLHGLCLPYYHVTAPTLALRFPFSHVLSRTCEFIQSNQTSLIHLIVPPEAPTTLSFGRIGHVPSSTQFLSKGKPIVVMATYS